MKKDNARKTAKSEARDISAYVCRLMVYGAVTGHGFQRADIERLCERYSDANPKLDVTKMPVLMWKDDGDPSNSAIVAVLSKHCADDCIRSKDGSSILLVGAAAKEIVSKLDFSTAKVKKLKTKIRLDCRFPLDRKLKCLGNARMSDMVKPRKGGSKGAK